MGRNIDEGALSSWNMAQTAPEWMGSTIEDPSDAPTFTPVPLGQPRHRLHLLPAMGIMGFAGAWLAADYFRMGATPSTASSRGVLIALTAVTAVSVGAMSASRKTFLRSVIVAAISTPTIGGLLGVATVWLTSISQFARAETEGAFWDGFAAGWAFLPAVVAVLFANRHVGRARHGSIVDGVDRRGAYVAAALAISLGAPIAVRGSDPVGWQLVRFDVTLAVSVLTTISLFSAAVLDWLAFSKARAIAAGWETLESHDPEIALVEGSEDHDLGLGEGVVGRVERRDAYRAQARIQSRVRGEPRLALATLKRAALFAALAFLGSVAATALTFSTAARLTRAPFERLTDDVSRDIAHALGQANPGNELEQLPLTCEAYFAMAGGCAERLSGLERADVSKRLSQVRDAWVTHHDRTEVEAACNSALHEALEHSACVMERSAASHAGMRR